MNNRAIRFRAWDTDKKEMISPEFIGHHWNVGDLMPPSDYPIMQFTGLKDSKGVEIYEGDIVEFEEPNFESEMLKCPVVFKNGSFVAVWDRDSSVIHFPLGEYTPYPIEEIEVIGNIYENPEIMSNTK